MKNTIFFICTIWLSITGFCRPIEVLDPSDPQFRWMDELIEKDFAKLPSSISSINYSFGVRIHRQNNWVVRLKVVNNQVEGPAGPGRHMLEYLCRVYGLPDVDLLYWQHDGLAESPPGTVPLFAGARTIGTSNSILFVDWYFDISNPDTAWYSEIKQIDNYNAQKGWQHKENKLFWRGSNTDVWSGGIYTFWNWSQHARGAACALSQEYPDLIDAAFSNIYSFLVDGSETGLQKLKQAIPMSPAISISEHLKYKYQLQVTGLMANFPRDKWQFYSGCTIFRHEPPHEMYWYSLVKPWEHYIPVRSDMSDLIEKVKWARLHDEDCYKMAQAARQFALEHIMPEHIALYCYKVLLRYAQILKN